MCSVPLILSRLQYSTHTFMPAVFYSYFHACSVPLTLSQFQTCILVNLQTFIHSYYNTFLHSFLTFHISHLHTCIFTYFHTFILAHWQDKNGTDRRIAKQPCETNYLLNVWIVKQIYLLSTLFYYNYELNIILNE